MMFLREMKGQMSPFEDYTTPCLLQEIIELAQKQMLK